MLIGLPLSLASSPLSQAFPEKVFPPLLFGSLFFSQSISCFVFLPIPILLCFSCSYFSHSLKTSTYWKPHFLNLGKLLFLYFSHPAIFFSFSPELLSPQRLSLSIFLYSPIFLLLQASTHSTAHPSAKRSPSSTTTMVRWCPLPHVPCIQLLRKPSPTPTTCCPAPPRVVRKYPMKCSQ